MKKKVLYLLGGITMLFIITNPSINSFKEHLGKTSANGMSRKYNFFLFSIYRAHYDYLGIAGNFFELTPPHSDYRQYPTPIYSKTNKSNDSLNLFSTDTTRKIPHKKNKGDSEIDKEITDFLKKSKKK